MAFGLWRWRQQAELAEQAAAVSAQIAAHAAQARTRNEDNNRVGTDREERVLPFHAPQSATPLPPWGEPLGANFDALRRRADAGDARAACRIGVELSLCTGTQPPQDPAADAPSTSSARANDCQGFDASLRGQAAGYLRKAALAGNADAMLRYASGAFSVQASDPRSHNEFLQDPVFGDWYDEALPMVQRALHAGDPRAAQLLANAYADDDGLFDARVPDDPVQARTYAVLLAYLREAAPPPPVGLDARQRAQADAQAQRIFRESFGSQPAKGGMPADPGLDGPPRPGQRAPCE